MTVVIRPSRAVAGRLEVPPSKSITHRAILCAALAGGQSHIANLAYSEDNNNSIYLFITNSNTQTVAGPITVASGDSLSQLEDVDTYESHLHRARAAAGAAPERL